VRFQTAPTGLGTAKLTLIVRLDEDKKNNSVIFSQCSVRLGNRTYRPWGKSALPN
jgi:hypothetical protein